MTAGALRTRVVLERPVRTADASGGAALLYEVVATVWAQIEQGSLREDDDGDRLGTRRSVTVTLRFRSDVAPGWRVGLGARGLRIRAVHDPDLTGRALILDTEEEDR